MLFDLRDNLLELLFSEEVLALHGNAVGPLNSGMSTTDVRDDAKD